MRWLETNLSPRWVDWAPEVCEQNGIPYSIHNQGAHWMNVDNGDEILLIADNQGRDNDDPQADRVRAFRWFAITGTIREITQAVSSEIWHLADDEKTGLVRMRRPLIELRARLNAILAAKNTTESGDE